MSPTSYSIDAINEAAGEQKVNERVQEESSKLLGKLEALDADILKEEQAFMTLMAFSAFRTLLQDIKSRGILHKLVQRVQNTGKLRGIQGVEGFCLMKDVKKRSGYWISTEDHSFITSLLLGYSGYYKEGEKMGLLPRLPRIYIGNSPDTKRVTPLELMDCLTKIVDAYEYMERTLNGL